MHALYFCAVSFTVLTKTRILGQNVLLVQLYITYMYINAYMY